MTWWANAGAGVEAPPAPVAEPSPSPSPAPPSGGPRAVKWFEYMYGISGYGKTVRMRDRFRARVAAGGRAVFVDTNGVNNDLAGPRVKVCDVATMVAEGRALAASGAGWGLVVQPGWGEDTARIWRTLYAWGYILASVDEVQIYASSDSLDKDYRQMVQRGRNRCVDVDSTCQAPTELHPRIRQNYDGVVSFRQGMPDYADRLAVDYFRERQAAAWLLELPKLHYLRKTATGPLTRGVIPCPVCGPLAWMALHKAGCPIGQDEGRCAR